MFARRTLIIAVVLATGACTPEIDYPPPPQKEIPGGLEMAAESRILRMDDPSLNARIVQDIPGREPAEWRWTSERPRVQLRLEPEPWVYHAGFVVPGAVLKKVGPVTLTFMVNGRVIGQQRYTEDRHFEFEAPVGAEIMRLADPVVFGFDVSPVYIAEGDGAKLGVLLEAIGFRKAKR